MAASSGVPLRSAPGSTVWKKGSNKIYPSLLTIQSFGPVWVTRRMKRSLEASE